MKVFMTILEEHNYQADIPDDTPLDEIRQIWGDWVDTLEHLGDTIPSNYPPRVTYIENMDTREILWDDF